MSLRSLLFFSRTAQHGFTLVEIIVVLAIMVMLAAVTISGILQYGQRQQYQEFVAEVSSGLAEARAQTLAGLNDTVYGVYIGTSTIEYFRGSVPVVGSPANTIVPIPPYVNATSSLVGDVDYVSFTRLTGAPSVTGTIMIGDRRGEATTTITLYESGLVQ